MAAAQKLLENIIHNLGTDWLLSEESSAVTLDRVVRDICNDSDLKESDLTSLRVALASLGAITEVVNPVFSVGESGG